MNAMENMIKHLENLKEIADKAKKNAAVFFKPETHFKEARLMVGGREHILVDVRAVIEFYKEALDLFGSSIAKDFLYRLGEKLGVSEAKAVFKAFKLEDPVMQCWERCLHAPYSLMTLGLAKIDILLFDAEMKEGFIMLCETRNSVFVDVVKDRKMSSSVCSLLAGYLNGWYKVATERKNLVTREIMCRAVGDEVCRFVIGKPKKMLELVKREDLKRPSSDYPVIEFCWE